MPAEGDSDDGVDYVTRRKMIGTGAAGVGAMLAGCSGDGGSTTDTGSTDDGGSTTDTGSSTQTPTDNPMEALHGWTGGDGAAAVEELVSLFEEMYPDTKHDIKAVGGDANVALNSVVARRLANRNPPDAFAGWPGANMTQYGGMLANMTSVMEENGYTDNMFEKSLEACRMNGEFRAVPLGSHRLNNLFYSIPVLEEAGVDPNNVTDWDSFITALDTVKSETDHIPMTMTTAGPWAPLQYFAQVMLGTEGQEAYEAWLNGEGDEQALVRALEKTANLIENYTNEDKASVSFPEANNKLIDGNAAFFTMGNWAYGMYRNAEDYEFEEDWGWNAFPGTQDMYVFHLDSFMFPRDGNAPVKSERFAEFIGSSEAQIGFNNLKGSIPLRTDVETDELTSFLQMNVEHLRNKEQFPRTLAHGLACNPDQLSACKDAIASNFMGPYEPEPTASGLMSVFE